MKYLFVFPIKLLISIFWIIVSSIGIVIVQFIDILWNMRIKWIFPMEIFSMNTNNIFDDEMDPKRVYPTIWHWLINGNYHSFK